MESLYAAVFGRCLSSGLKEETVSRMDQTRHQHRECFFISLSVTNLEQIQMFFRGFSTGGTKLEATSFLLGLLRASHATRHSKKGVCT